MILNRSNQFIKKVKYKKFVFCLFVFFTACIFEVNAQQNPQFSQYLQNPLVLNPAISGAENYIDFTLGYRNQWAGFEGAPKTGTFSFQSPAKLLFSNSSNTTESYSGVSALVYTDETGPISRSGYYLGYAYHLKASEDWFVSFGTFVGGTQFSFDNSGVILLDNPNDDLAQNTSSTSFDVSAGVYAYSDYLFLGIAANQLLDNEIQYDLPGNTITTGKINRNYNFLVGSRIPLDRDWTIVPAGVVRTVENAPVQWDLNLKAIYQNNIWGGISYRNEDSVYALLGVRFWENLSVSYSYDYSISEFQNNQSGSHEIIISYRILNGKNKCGCAVNSL